MTARLKNEVNLRAASPQEIVQSFAVFRGDNGIVAPLRNEDLDRLHFMLGGTCERGTIARNRIAFENGAIPRSIMAAAMLAPFE